MASMATKLHPNPTTVRMSLEDRAALARLADLTGVRATAALLRLAVREAVAWREGGAFAPPVPKAKRSRKAVG
jgi:hypothetical protein